MRSKKTLVLGASPNPERYSNRAMLKLRAHGHAVVAVAKRKAIVGDVETLMLLHLIFTNWRRLAGVLLCKSLFLK